MMDPNTEMAESSSVPLFYLKTTDKISGREMYVNFKCTSQVQAPSVDIDETKLVDEICNPSPNIEQYKIPLLLGKIYWSKDELEPSKKCYVTTVQMNDKFAYRKVVPSEVVRHYVISVVMSAIEDKFNHPNSAKLYGQFLGHQLDLDQAVYEVLGHGEKKNSVVQSNEVVENKVMFVDCQSDKAIVTDESTNEQLEVYDLYYRPKSQILTIQVAADHLPDRIEFNDDRVCIVGHKEKKPRTVVHTGDDSSLMKLIDIHLPLYIDLSVPVKYKFDDKLCLFRVVFKVLEEPLSR